MKDIIKYIRQIPGWLVMLAIFGVLYLTGLHTQVIGQAQRLILATGLMKPKVPVSSEPRPEGAGRSAAQPKGLAPFPLADYDFTLQDLEGKTVTLESLQGKVVFMNFWATWCPPCLAEMPDIQNLYEKVRSDKIAFVMVSLDENPVKVKNFIRRHGYTFPIYRPGGHIPPLYGSGNVIPTTYVLSPDGYVVVQKEGMAQYDTREFRDFLSRMAQTGKAL